MCQIAPTCHIASRGFAPGVTHIVRLLAAYSVSWPPQVAGCRRGLSLPRARKGCLCRLTPHHECKTTLRNVRFTRGCLTPARLGTACIQCSCVMPTAGGHTADVSASSQIGEISDAAQAKVKSLRQSPHMPIRPCEGTLPPCAGTPPNALMTVSLADGRVEHRHIPGCLATLYVAPGLIP